MNLSLSDTAYSHIGTLLEEHKKKYVRLQVKGGGCAGFEYEWSFEDQAEKDDHVIDDRLIVHKMMMNCQMEHNQQKYHHLYMEQYQSQYYHYEILSHH